MKKTFFVCGLLLLFAGGFFVCAKPAGAVATTTVPNPAVLSNTAGQFMSEQKFWFDGEHYRFSFTADRDFYTAWKHYGDRIIKFTYYAAYLSAQYQFAPGGGGSFGAYFVENVTDLNGYKSGDNIFFLWEKGRRYDTYIVDNEISPQGVSSSDMFLDYYFSSQPEARLVAEKSSVRFEVRYSNNEVNRSHPAAYLDYSYAPPAAKPDPVILIPGILGSWQVGGKWEVDPILHTYDNLWEALKTAGYSEGQDLFALPYQWRDSNMITAEKLREKINEVKAICECDKVDLVGHSMGGLVARAYIEGDNYQGDVDQVIFLATPHRGAPSAYLMWEGGSAGPLAGLEEIAFALYLQMEAKHNGYIFPSQYIRNSIKSVGELLPIYDYLRDKDTMALRSYPTNYPRNEFLELFNQENNLARLSQVKMYNFLGDVGNNSTIDFLRVVPGDDTLGNWIDGYPEKYDIPWSDHGLEYGPGDITVPQASNVAFAGTNNIVLNSSHGNIVTDAQKKVIKILTGKEPTQEIRNNFIKKFLMVRIFSPANFLIVTPDGKKLGRDSDSDTDITEIPGAFYSGSHSDEEFAVISNPIEGEYNIYLSGTDEGKYSLSLSVAGENALENTRDFAGNIVRGQQQEFKINYGVSSTLDELQPQIDLPGIIADVELFYQQNRITRDGRNKLLAPLEQLQRDLKLLSVKLDNFNKQLDNLLRQGKTSQLVYDILKADSDYLRNNLK